MPQVDGTVKWLNDEKGFGLLSKEAVKVHLSAINSEGR